MHPSPLFSQSISFYLSLVLSASGSFLLGVDLFFSSLFLIRIYTRVCMHFLVFSFLLWSLLLSIICHVSAVSGSDGAFFFFFCFLPIPIFVLLFTPVGKWFPCGICIKSCTVLKFWLYVFVLGYFLKKLKLFRFSMAKHMIKYSTTLLMRWIWIFPANTGFVSRLIDLRQIVCASRQNRIKNGFLVVTGQHACIHCKRNGTM